MLVDRLEQLPAACKLLAKETLLGFDTETRPSFKKGSQHQVSLLQLAGEEFVVLVRLNKVPFGASLAEFFSDTAVRKVGVAVRDDVKALQKLCEFKPASVIELADMARAHGLHEQGLRTITAKLFAQRLCKAARCSNWEREDLTPQQISYAATDAWISRQLYTRLSEITKL